MKCLFCGSEIYQEAYCRNCGATVEQMQKAQQGNPYATSSGSGMGTWETSRSMMPDYQQNQAYGQPLQQNVPLGGAGYGQPSDGTYMPGLSKKEFDNQPGVKRIVREIRTVSIILYICAGIIFALYSSIFAKISQYATSSMWWTWLLLFVDIGIVVGIGVGLQITKSRILAIILAVYAGISVLVGIENGNYVSGWLIVVCAIYAVVYTNKYHAIWENYCETGVIAPARKGRRR